MKVRVDVELKDFYEKPLLSTRGYVCENCGHVGGAEVQTMRSICIFALTSGDPPGRDGRAVPTDGVEQMTRFELALRFRENDEVELTTQEAARVQKLVAERFPPLITGQVWRLLEGWEDAFADRGEEVEG